MVKAPEALNDAGEKEAVAPVGNPLAEKVVAAAPAFVKSKSNAADSFRQAVCCSDCDSILKPEDNPVTINAKSCGPFCKVPLCVTVMVYVPAGAATLIRSTLSTLLSSVVMAGWLASFCNFQG
jgi:hypothetical protein